MSKMRFIFNRGKCELASYDSTGTAAEMIFPKFTCGEIIVGEVTYPISSGRANVRLSGFADGRYRPTLRCGDMEYPLPEIEKRGNIITFVGYTTEELCAEFDELRRARASLRELSEKYKLLEEYVFGKGLF